jgi:pimeloyl-ACP methyl ester carboxylesterase
VGQRQAIIPGVWPLSKSSSPSECGGTSAAHRAFLTKVTALFLISALAIFAGLQPSIYGAEEQAPQKAAVPLNVVVTGTGRPMILIPGLACGGNVWDSTVAYFQDRYQCHVLTLPGFAGEPAVDGPFFAPVRAAVIDYIRTQKLDHPIIVGHSLGAFLALSIAIESPDDVGPIVAVDGLPYYPALVMAGATPEKVRPMVEQGRKDLQAESPGFFATNNTMMLSAMITKQEDLEKVAALSNKSDPKAVGQAYYEVMTTDLREKVKAIRSPVLLLGAIKLSAGPDEKSTMEEAYRAQVAGIPRHKVVFAPESKHFIQLDAPDFFREQVNEFLKEAGR